MERFVLFLHILGSLAVGFYLLLPFVASKLAGMNPQAQVGYAKGIYGMNRIGQWLLIVQFLTGGYLISKYDFLTVTWMIVVIVLFVVLGAMSGMLAAPLKRIIEHGGEGKAAAANDARKLSSFSGVAALLVLVITILMVYPELL